MSEDSNEVVKEWIDKANADLDTAEVLFKQDYIHREITCFHCQQAAEKYLKAYLTYAGIRFPKTHDLNVLLELCKTNNDLFCIFDNGVMAGLTGYSVNARYPGMGLKATDEELQLYYQTAVKIKKFILSEVN